MKLMNASRQAVLLENLEKAGLVSRLVGLLGRASLPANQGLWIPATNSIHTFFMKFAIDVVFTDGDLKVCALYPNLRPWRVTPIVWKARNVFEMTAGTLEKNHVTVGDQLHVVS